MKTTVVNIRRNKYDVYIGRAGHGHDGTFGNPFSAIRDGGRENAVALYREYFLNRIRIDPEFASQIQSLKGKRLGCFCAPKLCHGNIIVEYLENTMKVLVCGGRDWTNGRVIRKRLIDLPCNTIVIEGGCKGADLIAREIALEIGLEVVEFPAAWKKYGRSAGINRNIKMLDTNPHLVIAFHDDISKSKGTKHTVSEARKRGIEVEVVTGRV
jgi:hypothetical protein